MMKKAIVLMVLACMVMLSGCAGIYRTPVVPSMGLLFGEITAPLDADMGAKTDLGSKKGEAMSTSVLGLIATGDCSIEAAANEGKITTIKHTDYKFRNILGVYSEFTTVVYGD